MPSRCPVFRGRMPPSKRREQGFALILVLAASAVAIAGLVAFIIRTSRVVAASGPDSALRRMDDLGSVARLLLLADLRQEMRAGSHYPLLPGETTLVRIQSELGREFLLYPSSPQTVVPARMAPEVGGGFQSDLPNLLKWSSRHSSFYAERAEGAEGDSKALFSNAAQFPAAAPAAPVSARSRPAVGRSLPAELWRSPGLLPASASGAPGGGPEPDWMLVTSSGKRVRDLGAQAYDPIVGRFAFVMYDQGGLLDWNVAGFAPARGVEDPVSAERGLKGGAAFADLGVLLQACGATAGDATEVVEALMTWRNRGSYLAGGSVSAAQRLAENILGERWGFLGWRPPGDRAFTGRRPLMDFVRRQFPGNSALAGEILQRSTHFSRALSQPSLYPEPRRPVDRRQLTGVLPGSSLFGGSAGAGDGSPAFLEQRVSGQANAPQEGQTVQGGSLGGARRADGSGLWPGQLLVPKRFPLTRLRILSEAESLREDALILQYFGLKKTGPLQPWIYRDSDRSPVRILSLAEVAALPPSQMREPDFLELLKAAIVPGALVSVAGASASPNSTDALLVQIFANLVDQCDGDGYPTQILFWDASSDSKARVFSGVEHLPYLHRVRSCVSMNRQSVPPSPFVSAEPVETGSLFSRPPASDPGSAWVWQDLGLWNPHVVSGSFAAAGPTRFRVVAQTPVAFGLRAVQTQSMVFEDTRLPGRAVDLAASDVVLEGEQIRFSIARAGLSALSRPVFISEACTARWIQVERGEQSRFPVDGALDAAGFGIVGIGVAEVPRVYNAQVQVGDSVRRFSVFPSHYEAEGVGEPSEPAKIRYTLEYQAPGSEQAPVWISYDQKMAVPFRAAVWAEGFAGGAVGATGVPEPWEFSDPRHHGVEVPEYAGGPHFPLFFFNRFGEFGVRVDADGVVRRASGAYAAGGSPGSTAAGLDRFALLTPEQLPVVINRPFRSVAEMAYAWSGMPWKQLDFSTPESGFAGLLDVFCVGENDHPLGIEAGRVNLNTRHPEVLEALLSGTRLDEAVPAGVLSTGSLGSARKLAEALVARTLSTDPSRGPLENVRDLVGSWRPSQSGTAAAMGTLNGSVVYQGFSADLPGALSGADRVLRSERARTAPIRALADAGQTRVWNLLVDIVVQTGRYPRSQPGSRVSGGRVMGPRERQAALESELEKFVIDAQQRFWWHLAVDRLTGAVVDEAVELVDF